MVVKKILIDQKGGATVLPGCFSVESPTETPISEFQENV